MNYETKVTLASKEQGITDLVSAMLEKGINAEIAQTGGFTMCAYIELKNGFYIYASLYGASVYDEENYEKDLAVFNEPQTAETITSAVWLYLQEQKGAN
jgi:hypothetical protein